MTGIPEGAWALVWEPDKNPQLLCPKYGEDDPVPFEGQILSALFIKLHHEDGFADAIMDEFQGFMEAMKKEEE